MKFIFALTCLMSALFSSQEASLLDKFISEASSSCVTMTCTWSTRISGVEVEGKGDINVQGNCWKMSGNGLEMYCDSSVLWVIDPSLKEVVVENAASDPSDGVLTNPALLFTQMKDVFDITQAKEVSSGGSTVYVLKPKLDNGIDYFNVELSSSFLEGGTIALTDGTLIKIEVTSIEMTPLRPVSEFRPKTVFDSSWIVTDLR